MTRNMTKDERIAQLEAALDASTQENVRLAEELADLTTGTEGLLELLAALLDAWQNEGDLQPILDAVAAELKRRQRTN